MTPQSFLIITLGVADPDWWNADGVPAVIGAIEAKFPGVRHQCCLGG